MNRGFEDGDFAAIPYGRNYIILHLGEQIEFAKTFREAKAKIKTGILTKSERSAKMKTECKKQ